MINIVLTLLFFWLLVLTLLFLRLRNHYYNLILRTKKRKIDEILDYLLNKDENFEKEIALIRKGLDKEVNASKFYLQKIGLVRFNPFERGGGEKSFVVALLDKENNGLTINFIYTRDGLRVYTKKVKNGEGEDYQLSEEERKAIKAS